jgi:hypothetical protein
MSSLAGIQDTILFDYVVNYVFPQYALPWNNFYTNIDAEPWFVRNEQRNVNARIAKSPLIVNSAPQLILQLSTLPDWVASVASPSNGSVLDTLSTKNFIGKLYSKDCSGLDYQYLNNGQIVGVTGPTTTPASYWAVLHFNLVNQNPKNNLSVVVVSNPNSSTPSLYSSVNGSITINGVTTNIKNAIPYGVGATSDPSAAIAAGTTNTLYTLYGNRIFLAIKTTTPITTNGSVNYNLQFRICETSTLSQAIGAPILA